jgi:ElaB/YqjD/DUF883 family membrane-anchored ribosome-binding protein
VIWRRCSRALQAPPQSRPGEAGEKLSARLAEARERLEAVEDRVMTDVKRSARGADRLVRDNPWPAIGIAAAAAFLLGVLLSRRN